MKKQAISIPFAFLLLAGSVDASDLSKRYQLLIGDLLSIRVNSSTTLNSVMQPNLGGWLKYETTYLSKADKFVVIIMGTSDVEAATKVVSENRTAIYEKISKYAKEHLNASLREADFIFRYVYEKDHTEVLRFESGKFVIPPH